MAKRSARDQMIRPLAQGLAQQDWTLWDIQQHLERRLPARLRSKAQPLAEELKQSFPAATAPDARLILTHLKDSKTASALLRHIKRTGQLPAAPTAPPAFRPVAPLANLALPQITTREALADWLSLSQAQLTRFSDLLALSAHADTPFAPHYRHHQIGKRDGNLRLIEEPKPFLKHLQRRVLRGILAHIPPHPAAFGFCAGKSCAQAAARHAGEEIVLSFDLSGFFPSIAHHRVYGLFRSFGYPATVARHLTGLTTAVTPHSVRATPNLAHPQLLSTRHLPQGAPTSPALANLAAFALDVRLSGLARVLGAHYTRYADDLTFSGNHGISNSLQRAVPDIVRACGFHLNPRKTRIQPAHRQQRVTGIVVNRHLNLPRDTYDRLKATIHHLRAPDDPRRTDPAFIHRLAGQIAWLEQLNPARGAKLRDRLADALQSGPNR